ncbi:MAG: BolA family protein [Alphaproteobacteria bacterium]|nr:BolA family protein [Alphaproteobacteria bacterium]
MSVAERIEQKLEGALSPTRLRVIDDSHKHAGHAGARPGGETHFRVEIISPAFEGKTRIERHRMVNALLTDEFADRLHALQVTARTPAEAQS